MTYEARITVHQTLLGSKPDYDEIHHRLRAVGFTRVLTVGGQTLNELHGMYRKILSLRTLAVERALIEGALRHLNRSFSIELFAVGETTTFNLLPAPAYSALAALGGLR